MFFRNSYKTNRCKYQLNNDVVILSYLKNVKRKSVLHTIWSINSLIDTNIFITNDKEST